MGTHGLDVRLKELGVNVSKNQLKKICDNIKVLADKGKTVTDVDLQAIADNVLEINHKDRIKLNEVIIVSGNKVMPTASVKLTVDGEEVLNAGVGIGPVDAAINAVNSLDIFDKIITGEDIEAGDVLIGIESNGIHSNGYSLARKALFDDAGFSIDDKMPNCDTTIGEELIRPTELYVKPIVALFKEEYDIHGLAHITGGGFTNLRRLKKGVGYDIYDLPEAPEIFKLIYQQNVPLEEMYKVFNMGIGFVVITNENEAEKIMETLKDYCNCQIIGKVTDDEKITVKTFEGSAVTY